MRWWKVVGLAGLTGVAATGAVVARSERRRRAYSSEEIRERLHARVQQAGGVEGLLSPADPAEVQDRVDPRRLRALRTRALNARVLRERALRTRGLRPSALRSLRRRP